MVESFFYSFLLILCYSARSKLNNESLGNCIQTYNYIKCKKYVSSQLLYSEVGRMDQN